MLWRLCVRARSLQVEGNLKRSRSGMKTYEHSRIHPIQSLLPDISDTTMAENRLLESGTTRMAHGGA
jgi:hypothetical protein